MSAKTWKTSSRSCCRSVITTSKKRRRASSTSTRSIRSRANRTIPPSRAMYPARAGRKHPQQEFLQVDTTNILFICGGAFSGLEKVIRDRTQKGGIGFGAQLRSRDNAPALGEVLS